MAESETGEIRVELVYARPELQYQLMLQLPPGTTVRAAVLQADLVQRFPELDPQHCPVGIFGRQVSDAYVLQAGDRVEIYRPLQLDPRSARRQRARQIQRRSPGAAR